MENGGGVRWRRKAGEGRKGWMVEKKSGGREKRMEGGREYKI